MGRSLDTVIESLPKKRRERINSRYRELKMEVETLQALRKAAGKAQTDIAAVLKISQPSVSKIEKQADMYLSTLRNYVAAIGGDLDLVVRFPKQPPIRLSGLGEILEDAPATQREHRGAPRRKTGAGRSLAKRPA